MTKIVMRVVKYVVLAPLTILGIGVAGVYGFRHYDVALPLLDGRTVLRVMEVQQSGNTWNARRYTLTEKNLYIDRLQGVEIGSLKIATSRHVETSESQRETILDIASTVTPMIVPGIETANHFVSIMIGGDKKFYTTVPEKQQSAAILIRTLDRFSR